MTRQADACSALSDCAHFASKLITLPLFKSVYATLYFLNKLQLPPKSPKRRFMVHLAL